MAPSSNDPSRSNLFRWLASIGARRPWLVLAVSGALAIVAAISLHGIQVSTSHYALVSGEQNEHQARVLRFFERFGIQDPMVLVLSGGTPEEQRGVQRAICDRLEREPEFAGRTLCRIGPGELAEVALLWDPTAVQKEFARGGTEGLATTVEGGLPAWVQSLETSLTAALEDGSATASDAASIEKGPAMLARMLRALDDQLAGRDGLAELDLGRAAAGAGAGTQVDAAGYLVGGNGEHHLIALFPALPGSEGYELEPLVSKVRRIYGEVSLGSVRPALTGMPAIATDELDAINRGLDVSTIGTSIGILLLLFIGYRSIRYSIMAVIPLGVGTLLTVAVAKQLFHGLNVVTSSFVSVLMGIGINFALFVLSRYSEELRDGASQRQALEGAVVKTGTGLVMSAVTTILAFLTVTTTNFTAFKQLGVLVGVGLVIMLLLTLLVSPATAMAFNRAGKRLAADRFVGLDRLEPFIRRGKWPLLVVAVVVSIFGGLYAFQLRFNPRYFDFLPAHAESVRGLEVIESERGASPVVSNHGASGVEEARTLAAKLRALPDVGSVDTATDLLPPLTSERLEALRDTLATLGPMPDFDRLRHRARSASALAERISGLEDALDEVAFAMRKAEIDTASVDSARKACADLRKTLASLPDDGHEALAAVERGAADVIERAWRTAANVAARGRYEPSDLPSAFRARYASKDGSALAVYAQPGIDIWDEERGSLYAREIRSVDPEASGFAMEVDVYQNDIKRAFTLACYLTAALALATCLIGFRSLRDSLLALIPVAIGLAAMMAFMAIGRVPVNVANIVAFPLLLGMGVEAGVHIMNRCRQSASARGGVAWLRDMIEGTGTAVMLASTTTIVGFGALMLADYRAMKGLGLVMCVGMTTNLVAALVFLPAFLVAVGRAK